MRNEYGFITGDRTNPLEIRNYDRDDYLAFISSIFDVDNPIHYDHGKATARKREAELHKLAVDAAQQRITAAATATAGIMAGGGAGNSSGNSTGGNTTTTNTSLSSGNNNTYTYDPAAEKLRNLKKRKLSSQIQPSSRILQMRTILRNGGTNLYLKHLCKILIM